MNKPGKGAKTPDISWDIDPIEAETPEAETKPDADVEWTANPNKPVKPGKKQAVLIDHGFDLEGLMTDFPTATELQRFVYDQTGIVLNLKGRSNKLKYQIAMDVLNGAEPDPAFTGTENPYLDKIDLIPEDPLKDVPQRPAELEGLNLVTRFGTNSFPHPHPEWKAQDVKAQVVFRKYDNNVITYEILGPIAKVPVGQKINKFGQKVPEKLTWIDPRTGEQIVRRANGTYTPVGSRLRNFMMKQKVNKSNQWDTWIDRDFIAQGELLDDNPWGAM
jgi:hypothetical protein